jgi:Sulfotransferase domain
VRVVIVGLGKSGTTAALYAVRSAMPADTQLLFEPRSYVAVLQATNVVAKVLLNPRFAIDHAFYRQFDKIVLLVRDPRDVLISKLLYRTFGSKSLNDDPAKLEQYLELLRAKEANPRSVPLIRINALYEELSGPTPHSDEGRERFLKGALVFHDAFPDCMVFKYETMVSGQFDVLARYLSLDPEAMNPQVPTGLSRVVRSRRAGNWRDWFCPEDVAHYRPSLSPYMERYAYADEWELAGDPLIRPEECSGYVMRLIHERRTGTPAPIG